MQLYLGVNQDGSEIISKQKIKRFINMDTNKRDVLSYNDTIQPPHWMLDYEGIKVGKRGDMPVNVYLTLPSGSIEQMFGIKMTWEDNYRTIELGTSMKGSYEAKPETITDEEEKEAYGEKVEEITKNVNKKILEDMNSTKILQLPPLSDNGDENILERMKINGDMPKETKIMTEEEIAEILKKISTDKPSRWFEFITINRGYNPKDYSPEIGNNIHYPLKVFLNNRSKICPLSYCRGFRVNADTDKNGKKSFYSEKIMEKINDVMRLFGGIIKIKIEYEK